MTRLVFVLAVGFSGAAHADLFSPGPLSRPHADLEGLSNCTECHPAGGQLSAETCLLCHKELEGRWKRGAGYHGRLPAEKKGTCEACHHEHQGRDFALVSWGKAGRLGFEHKLTGWPLDGAHLEQKCEGCHERRRIKEPAILKLLEKQPKRQTYLGVGDGCAACHFDEHRGQVGADCKACHDTREFKKAPGFDHDDTDYPLRGKHVKVACKLCHPTLKDLEGKAAFPPAKGEAYLKYEPLEFKACTDCHKDPHEGRFGNRCQSCHVVEGWQIVRDGRKDREFHAKTRYPLEGEHEDVECRACHGPWPGKKAKFKGLPFAECGGCHPDAHVGQVTIAKKAGLSGCSACHTVDGFAPARFDAEAHQKTSYRLEGAHRVVGCRSCHPPAPSVLERVPAQTRRQLAQQRRRPLFSPAQLQLKLKTDRCDSCHRDVHAGQFKAACASCHRTDTFRLPAFDHAKTRYPLEGAHAPVACGKCHGADDKGVVRYAPLPLTCEACHQDVHLGQFADRQADRQARGAKPADCARCHGVKAWKELNFRHQPPFTAYVLEGRHAKVKCERCHPQVALGKGAKASRYKPLPTECEGCHQDFHQGSFAGFTGLDLAQAAPGSPPGDAPRAALGLAAPPKGHSGQPTRCAACHSTASWSDSRFDHAKTGFRLEGRHAQTGCKACHPVDFQRAVPAACGGCHVDVHAGELGGRCEGCHDPASWKSRFAADAHRLTAFPLVGRHAALPCGECHFTEAAGRFSRAASGCGDCHQREYDATRGLAVDHPALGLPSTCQGCHQSWSFRPARFPTHEVCFTISAGEHANLACLECHTSLTSVASPGTCSTGTAGCTGCHEHACVRSDPQHAERGVLGYRCQDQKCYGCHKLSSGGP